MDEYVGVITVFEPTGIMFTIGQNTAYPLNFQRQCDSQFACIICWLSGVTSVRLVLRLPLLGVASCVNIFSIGHLPTILLCMQTLHASPPLHISIGGRYFGSQHLYH